MADRLPYPTRGRPLCPLPRIWRRSIGNKSAIETTDQQEDFLVAFVRFLPTAIRLRKGDSSERNVSGQVQLK